MSEQSTKYLVSHVVVRPANARPTFLTRAFVSGWVRAPATLKIVKFWFDLFSRVIVRLFFCPLTISKDNMVS